MSKMIKTLLTLSLAVSVCGASYGQTDHPEAAEKTATFVFLPGNDLFLLKGNETELERLYAWVEEYRTEITAGAIPVYVDGYCASLPTSKENLTTAFVRANRVKSELTLHKGLTEADFITNNYACAYQNNKDIVVVTLRIPAMKEPDSDRIEQKQREQAEREHLAQAEHERQAQALRERIEQERMLAEAERAERERAEAEHTTRGQAAQEPVAEATTEPAKPYCFAVRTNVLYDAMLLPTPGIEWRINRDLGIKLDGSFSWWNGENGKVQKTWLLNPEVRWYLLRDKRFYVGAAGSYGQYNIYKYAIGSIVSKDTGYQGKLWNVGMTVGYQLLLSRSFSLDFNLGLGYTRFDYDTFGITDGVRVYKGRDRTKNFWGPTQAGISLMWTIGGNK